MDPIQFGVAGMMMIVVGGGVVVLGILVLGWTRKWSRQVPGADREELTELREILERLTEEVGDLHERMEFTERVLAASRDPARLQGESS